MGMNMQRDNQIKWADAILADPKATSDLRRKAELVKRMALAGYDCMIGWSEGTTARGYA